MLRTYLTLGLIAVLILAGWRYGVQQREIGRTLERAEWQAKDLARQGEIQKLTGERDQARRGAETAKARSETRKAEKIRETRKIHDVCADTAVEPDLYSLYTP